MLTSRAGLCLFSFVVCLYCGFEESHHPCRTTRSCVRTSFGSHPPNTDSASAAAHIPSAVAEARTQVEARRYHTSTGEQQQRHTHRGTRGDRSSSSRVARGGVLCDCVLHGRDDRDDQREKMSCGGGGCGCGYDGRARGSSEGVNAGANATMRSGGVSFAGRGPLLSRTRRG